MVEVAPLRLSDTPTKLPCCPVPTLESRLSGLTLLRVLGAGPRACLAGLSKRKTRQASSVHICKRVLSVQCSGCSRNTLSGVST